MNNLQTTLGYTFNNSELLLLALTHSSFAHKYHLENNERLEYLGDSILGFCVADFLYRNFDLKEGELSKIRSKLVSSEHLSEIITNLKIEKYLKTEPSTLNRNSNIKGDLFEALIGAIYLDSNLETCKNTIYRLLNLSKENVEKVYKLNVDFKTKLQEYLQSKNQKFEYIVIGEEGRDNEKVFEVELLIDGKLFCLAKGYSKQKAENKCAELAIKKLLNVN